MVAQRLSMDSERKKKCKFGHQRFIYTFGHQIHMDILRLTVLAIAIGLTLWRTHQCVTKYLQFRRDSEVIHKVSPTTEDSISRLPDFTDGE